MRTILVLIFFTVLQLQFFGQTEPKPDRILPVPGLEEDAYQPDSLLEVHNAIKLDPLQVFRGEIPVFYERRISNRVSIEIGVGVTRRNWTLPWFDVDADDLRRNIDVHTGLAGRLGVRYYFLDSPELNGMYIMPQVAFRRYEKRFNDLDSTGMLSGESHLDRRDIGEFNLCFGIQQLSRSSNFLFDIYFGIGYARRNNMEVRRLPDNSQTIFVSEPIVRYGFTPVLGLKLGWGF